MRTIKRPPIIGSFKREDYERAVKAALNTKMVKCAGCGVNIPHEEPYPEEEQLCEECHKIVSELIEKGEL